MVKIITMGDCNNVEIINKKRAREDDSDELNHDSPESKRVQTNTQTDPATPESPLDMPESDRTESNSDELDSSKARMIQDDLLDMLDDTETVPGIQDLDSVIRSFEEEILQASPSAATQAVAELASDSGESQPELGYLLEASDDELGLPPTGTSSDVQPQYQYNQYETSNNVSPQDNADDLVGLANITGGFDEDLHSYDTFGLDICERSIEGGNHNGGDYVTVDGLFDYAEPSDFSEFGWRPESLPAL